jgi:hypothetical protein
MVLLQAAMFRDFILACKDNSKYSNMNARIYAKMAERVVILVIWILELTKSLFSTFDLVRERSLEFKLNQDKFESSDAKKIERLIAGIIQAEMNYEKEMEEWESNEKVN